MNNVSTMISANCKFENCCNKHYVQSQMNIKKPNFDKVEIKQENSSYSMTDILFPLLFHTQKSKFEIVVTVSELWHLKPGVRLLSVYVILNIVFKEEKNLRLTCLMTTDY